MNKFQFQKNVLVQVRKILGKTHVVSAGNLRKIDHHILKLSAAVEKAKVDAKIRAERAKSLAPRAGGPRTPKP